MPKKVPKPSKYTKDEEPAQEPEPKPEPRIVFEAVSWIDPENLVRPMILVDEQIRLQIIRPTSLMNMKMDGS